MFIKNSLTTLLISLLYSYSELLYANFESQATYPHNLISNTLLTSKLKNLPKDLTSDSTTNSKNLGLMNSDYFEILEYSTDSDYFEILEYSIDHDKRQDLSKKVDYSLANKTTNFNRNMKESNKKEIKLQESIIMSPEYFIKDDLENSINKRLKNVDKENTIVFNYEYSDLLKPPELKRDFDLPDF